MEKGEKLERKKINFNEEFNLTDYKYFCENCMLSDIQEKILYYRIKGKTILQISFLVNASTRTVDREIAKIKKKIYKII